MRLGLCIILITGASWAAAVGAMNSEYPADQAVTLYDAPPRLEELANHSGRVHGYFHQTEDFLFYTGTAREFSLFLSSYSNIRELPAHHLIIHEGKCLASTPWKKQQGIPCGWMLRIYPSGWIDPDAEEKTVQFEAEVHFWVQGDIPLEKVEIPERVSVKKPSGTPAD